MSILLGSPPPRTRLIVLGLDGLPLDLARQLAKTLPNIGRLAQSATSVQAELPELSPVNWTSFYTGKGPEDHTIFGFSRIDPHSYQLSINTSEHVATPTIFDRLGDAGFVSRIVNLPNTYPARPLRGMMVAGFVAHDLEKAVYPPFFASKLNEIGYKLEADTTRKRDDLEYLLSELRATLASRLAALDMLWADLSWDLFVHVFTETDRLFHFFMDAVVHDDHPQHAACMDFLADWDHAIGVLLTKFDELPSPKRLMVMADHGFTEIKTEFCLNTWLKQEGLLSLTGTPADGWDASHISSDSKAFALDPGRIYIHTAARFARGPVQTAERTALIEHIRAELLNLTLDGVTVMEAVHTGQELYPDADDDQLPDLVCQSKPGYDLKAKFDRTEIFGLHGRTGTHTVDGAIFYDTDGSQPERMRDIGTTVLKHFNTTDS